MIDKEENELQNQKIEVLNNNFKLEKFTTQEEIEKFLTDKLYNKIIDYCYDPIYNHYYYPLYRGSFDYSLRWDRLLMEEKAVWLWDVSSRKMISSSDISYGKTNIQKEGIDEPEILKLTQDYIAYFDKKTNNIYIIKSPVVYNKIDLDLVKVTDTIKVPKLINWTNLKLFFIDNQLIVIWNRYSKVFGWQITDLVFYKIKNWKATFSRFYDVKWKFIDARVVSGKVYLITNYRFSTFVRNICEKYVNKPLEKDFIQLKDAYYKQIEQINAGTRKYSKEYYNKLDSIMENYQDNMRDLIDKQISKINKQKLLSDLEKTFQQKSIDIYVDKTKKFEYKWKIYPIGLRLVNSAANNIFFIPANIDDISIDAIDFNLVNIVDIDTKKNPNQYIIFGDMWNWEIHMTKKSLYLVNNYYTSVSWRCPIGFRCIMPYIPSWNYTLIHKLDVNWFNLNYVDSQIIHWKPINQYSMDEDSKWNFRIFTKYYSPERATDLYVFDDKLNLKSKIQWIAKWEDFKSSRFIEDKAFLVTFKATDPLFVIDLKDISQPKVIGELKIPWYSLYLHPLYSNWNVQYLLWIGQEAKEVHNNWSLPKNIKIDIYKVDYSKTVWDYCLSKSTEEEQRECFEKYNIEIKPFTCGECPKWADCSCVYSPDTVSFDFDIAEMRKDKNWNNIYVEQLYSYVLWNEKKVWNWGSYTPVFDNPRTFVYDKDLKLLLLPVYLVEDKIEKKCYRVYDEDEIDNVVDDDITRLECNEYTQKVPYFIWVKWLKIDLNKGIEEVISKNYMDLYKKALAKKGYSLPRQRTYKNENHRVSYYRVWSDFVPFEINNNFLDMFKGDKDKFIVFNPLFKFSNIDSLFKSNKNIPSKCFYKKPAPGTITCQMYCGKRWVLENWKCKSIIVSAACSCPGFDTQQQCEENCEK